MRKVELKIEDVAFGGKGVGREQGKAVFVPFTIDSETVSAEIIREKKQFAEGELVAIRESSPHRASPKCPYFGRCGGCSYQHIDDEHQLAIKWRQVRDVLQRIGRLKNVPMRPIVPSPLMYHYRNRITVHAQDGIVGFFRRDSHRLIDVEFCPIALDQVNHALDNLRASRPRDGHYTLRAAPAARLFSQTNDAVAAALGDLVNQLIPSDQERLVDAYCGAGFFAKRLLDRFETVIGIDWDKFAIAAARETATDKESYIAGDVETELASVLETKPGPTTLIVDPPSTGMTTRVRQAVLDACPTTLIYVSCNPSTLARDLAELQQRYVIESVTPLDMFPQTAEIEVAVHLHSTAISG